MKYPLLGKIKQPSDIKSFRVPELRKLATEVRSRIIDVMAVNGGHLASNLGSVELTIALHKVFDSPADKFIFDVSHQTYTHKLLTGRNNTLFDKIRKAGGGSGFAHPGESEHDHFFAGHAGTALSLAEGVARSRDLTGGQEHVIPIIGDASLTCGLTLEALNNLSRDLKRFIIILNDNAMSISENVGGITNMLSRLLSNPTTNKIVHEMEHLLTKIPKCGSQLARSGNRLAKSVKNMVSSAPFFEHFGLSYIGPVDGHDIKKLVSVLEGIKDLSMPVVLHLYTQKGHGLPPAENDPITFHGVRPFDPSTCEFIPAASNLPTFPKLFGKKLVEMGQEDDSVVVVTPAMSLGSCLDPFMKKFPDRAWDVGIAEGHAVTFAGGLAKDGNLKVICSIYATFLQRAFDNLFHDVCMQRIPVVFAIDRAGLAAADGVTHHGIYDISFLKAMPHMVICQPRNGNVLRDLVSSAFSWKLPTAIRYPNVAADFKEQESTVYRALGKGEILAEGQDLLIIPLGIMVNQAFKLRDALFRIGITATIFDPVFVKPLDTEALSELMLTHNRVVTIEEHSLKGGLGCEVNNFLMSHGFKEAQVLNFGVPEAFFDHGDYNQMLDAMGMSPEKMLQKILSSFSFSKAGQLA